MAEEAAAEEAAAEEAAAAASNEATARTVTLYKGDKNQRLGISFLSVEDARRRGNQDSIDEKLTVVAMVAEDGPAYTLLRRGERVISVGGVALEGPVHAANTLRQSEGYLKVTVLPPLEGFDDAEEDEDEEEALPRTSRRDGEDVMKFPSKVTVTRLLKRANKAKMVALLQDFGVTPWRGASVQQVAELLAEQLHYETDEEEAYDGEEAYAGEEPYDGGGGAFLPHQAAYYAGGRE